MRRFECERDRSRKGETWAVLYMHVMLPSQVVEISEYRSELYEYLKNRMMAIAPNLTLMVGELVGARLIAHAGEHAHWVIKTGL